MPGISCIMSAMGVILGSIISVSFSFQLIRGEIEQKMYNVLNLNSSKLTETPKDMATDVNIIYLSTNYIANLPSQSFPNLPNCIEVSLYRNWITKIEVGSFAGLENLEKLNLNTNRIKYIFIDAFLNLRNLQTLLLFDNSLAELTKGIWNGLISLQVLDLGHNSISQIEPETFIDLHNLTFLSLTFNKLTEIKKDMWTGLNSLSRLDLIANDIVILDTGCFSSVQNLEHLDLRANDIAEITYDVMKDLGNLRNLSLESNEIHNITSGTFRTLIKLQKLNFGYNKLKVITKGVWERLVSLKELDLRWNKIEEIEDGGFSYLKNLEILYLHANDLVTIGPDVFNAEDYPDSNGHPRHLMLSLSGNKFECDNRLCWLKQGQEDDWIIWYELEPINSRYGRVHVPNCNKDFSLRLRKQDVVKDWASYLNCSSSVDAEVEAVKLQRGVLVGASVGGVCALVILLGVLIWCRFSGYGCRPSRRSKEEVKELKENPAYNRQESEPMYEYIDDEYFNRDRKESEPEARDCGACAGRLGCLGYTLHKVEANTENNPAYEVGRHVQPRD